MGNRDWQQSGPFPTHPARVPVYLLPQPVLWGWDLPTRTVTLEPVRDSCPYHKPPLSPLDNDYLCRCWRKMASIKLHFQILRLLVRCTRRLKIWRNNVCRITTGNKEVGGLCYKLCPQLCTKSSISDQTLVFMLLHSRWGGHSHVDKPLLPEYWWLGYIWHYLSGKCLCRNLV